MRITVELDDRTLRDLARATGLRKKSPAVAKAVAEYLKRENIERVIRTVREGRVGYGATASDLKKRRAADAHRQFRVD